MTRPSRPVPVTRSRRQPGLGHRLPGRRILGVARDSSALAGDVARRGLGRGFPGGDVARQGGGATRGDARQHAAGLHRAAFVGSISVNRPEAGAGTSTETLSVSSSHSISSRATVSPPIS
jgi:hypothetical protein